MTTASRFSRRNDAGLRALNVALWENLVLVVVLVLESKGPYLSIPRIAHKTRGLFLEIAENSSGPKSHLSNFNLPVSKSLPFNMFLMQEKLRGFRCLMA